MKAEDLRELIREVLKEQEEAQVDDKGATKLKTGSMSGSQRLRNREKESQGPTLSSLRKNKRL